MYVTGLCVVVFSVFACCVGIQIRHIIMTIPAAFRPILKFSQFFGLATFAEHKGKMVPHMPARVYSAFVLMALLYLQLLILQDRSGTTKLSASLLADTLDTYGFAFTCLGSFLVHVCRFPELCKIFNKFSVLSARYPESANSSKRTTLAILCGIAYEIVFTVFSIFISPLDYVNYGFYVLETLTYVSLELVSFIIFLQFVHLVLACSSLFRSLNKKFDIILKEIDSPRQIKTAVLLGKLKFLLNEHAEVTELCFRINECFGIQNLLSVTLCFLELTYALYHGLINSLDAAPINVFSDTFLWAGYFLYKLLATIKACSTCIEEQRTIRKILHKAFYYIEEDPLRAEVEYFSLQLIHCNIQFDAFGFFPLNFPVLHSIIGVVAGYLVILAQSHITTLTSAIKNCSDASG